MPNTNLLRSLERLHRKVAGELEALEAPAKAHHVRRKRDRHQRAAAAADRVLEADRLRTALKAIELVARLDSPSWTPEGLKAVRPMKRHQTLGHGALSRAVRDVLRSAGGTPLTTKEITVSACERLGLPWEGDLKERFRDNVGTILLRLSRSRALTHDDAPRDRRYWLSADADD